MKYLLLLITFSGLLKASAGQLTRKTWLVGGSGSLYSFTENYTTPNFTVQYKYNDVNALASIGHFLADKFVAGIRPSFSLIKGHSTGSSGGVSGGSTHTIRYAIGPFVRYYFLKADNTYNLLVDVSYEIGINKYLGALHEKGKYNTFSIMGGTEIFFNTVAGLEILFGYTQKITSIENSPGEFNSNKRGFQASIGFQLHLEKE